MNTTSATTPVHPTDRDSRVSCLTTAQPAAAATLATTDQIDGCRLEVRCTERPSFYEYHVTALVEEHTDTVEGARAMLRVVADYLTEHRIQPISEKIYGRSEVRTPVLALRDEIFRHHELDVRAIPTWLEGLPLGNCAVVGQQIWGVVPRVRGVEVTTVETPGVGYARLWEAPGFRMLHLPFVRGTREDGSLVGDEPAQTEAMFANAEIALKSQGFGYAQVVRTWIYMGQLLEWYDDFNRVRTSYYRPAGFGGRMGCRIRPAPGFNVIAPTRPA